MTSTADHVVLTLENFSTGEGSDQYINLNPGTLTENAAGDIALDNPSQYQAAGLKARTGNQSYDLTPMRSVLSEIHSVTIYSNKSLQAFGTANLVKK